LLAETSEGRPDTVAIGRAARAIAERQYEVERLTFLHFAELKELVGDDRDGRLKSLLDEMFMRQGEDRPPRRPPGDRR
jgi:hypothetical protein